MFIIQQKGVLVKGLNGAGPKKVVINFGIFARFEKNCAKGLTGGHKSGKLNRHSTRRKADVHKERCPSGLRKQS